jgi:hypothetical protein
VFWFFGTDIHRSLDSDFVFSQRILLERFIFKSCDREEEHAIFSFYVLIT